MTATVDRRSVGTTAGASRAARARRRAGRGPDRRRRHELPRLPAARRRPARRRRRRRASSTRGPGRCRPASRRRSCSSPASASRCSPAASIGDRDGAVAAKRWTLVRRGLVLYGGGLAARHDLARHDPALLRRDVRRRRRAVHAARRAGSWPSASAPPLAGAGIAWWRLERRLDGHDTTLADRTRAAARRVACCSTRSSTAPIPLLPWLAFFCAGIVLGRAAAAPAWWRPAAIAGGLRAVRRWRRSSAARRRRRPRRRAAQHRPVRPRRSLYTASALGTALVAFAVVIVAGRALPAPPPVALLGDAGAMSLTLYVAHALVFELVVDQLGWVRPTGPRHGAGCSPPRYWVVRHRRPPSAWHRRVRHRPGRVALPPPRRAEPRHDRSELLERVALARVAGVVAAAEPLTRAARTCRG